tara:strand:- start:61 stop:594 length:534 start_codon:yes stop_codon:yes gene_type:complete
MIITCNNCNKKFDVNSSLIPEKGRLVQCHVCKHKWYFKNEIIDKPIPIVKINTYPEEEKPVIEEITLIKKENSKTKELLDSVIVDVSEKNKISITEKPKKDEIENDDYKKNFKRSKNNKSYNVLGLTIVFIISFIALILFLDTFQKQISNVLPNIEFLLYNLYETLNDIILFFKDLI